MKRLLALCYVLILVGCTGTNEEEPPVFVIVGVQNGLESQLVLFEDAYKTASDSNPRFKPFGTATLEAPAVAFDIVDRINSRSELIVLTRKDDGTSFLQFFSLLGIQNDTDFAENTSKKIILSTLTDLPATLDLCPTSIQVTRDGALAAIQNNPKICGGSSDGSRSILLIDLSQRRYLNQLERSSFKDFRVPSLVSVRLDQKNDALYFLTERGQTIELNRLERNLFTSSDPSAKVTKYTPSLRTDTNLSDFIQYGSDALILNRSQNLYTYASLSGDLLENTNVPTLNQGLTFIEDPSNKYPQVFVLNGQRIAIHSDPRATTTSNRIEGPSTAKIGTINTFSDFLYLARDKALEVYDLLELQRNPTTVALEVESSSRNAALDTINNPSILTWFQGVINQP